MSIRNILKKFLIWAILAVILGSALLGFVNPAKKAKAETRPPNCYTISGSVTGGGSNTLYRCATLSPGGYTLHIWDGDFSQATTDTEYVYVGTTDWGPRGDIGPWAFRSKSDPNYYITVSKKISDIGGLTSLYLTHHYRRGANTKWNQYSGENQHYIIIKTGDDVPNLPDYTNAFSGGNRFVWNLIVNGEVKLNNESISPSDATVQVLIDGNNGPALSEIHEISSTFEFSETAQRGNIWINEGTVNQVVFYVRFLKDEEKYEKYITKDVWGGFTNASRDNAKLAHLGVINFTSADEVSSWTRDTGGEDTIIEEVVGEGTCGVKINPLHPVSSTVFYALAKVLCAILYGIGEIGAWLIDTLGIDTVINAYHSPPHSLTFIQKAYAADPTIPNQSSIKNALNGNPDWVLDAWKVILGLADVFVVIVLLFLAITSILHIQYDTYAIKKSLPTLIIGVILANFSILITKMLVDATNALTATFAGGDPGTAVKNLITAVIPTDGAPPFMGSLTSIGTLIIAIFFAFFAIIAFLILGFLFYIRYIVILTLTIVAPLAFVLMAFPPTQGIFKQWLGWYMRFIFMKPVSIFLVWLASEVISAGGKDHLTPWAIAVFLVCAAIIVPFKMGGAVMGAWGKAGKWLASPATNAAKSAYEGKRDAWKLRAGNWVNRNTALGRRRASHELEMATLQGEQKGILQKREAEVRKRKGSRQHLREEEIQFAAGEVEAEKLSQQTAIESGNFNHISARQMRKITGERDQMEVALKYVNQANALKMAQEGLSKRRDLDLQMTSVRDLRKDAGFRDSLEAMQLAGDGISADYTEDGTATTPGSTKLTYDRAFEVAEELRFRAKSETDQTKRQNLKKAADHFDQKARNFAQSHQTFTHGTLAGQKIDYNHYLSRNLFGRRMKVLNPAVVEEANVQVISSTHTDLIDDTSKADKTFGTSEWRAKNTDYDQYLNGNISGINASAAYACLVQSYATKQVMDTGRRGDIKGLETMQLFSDRVKAAGRTDFKTTLAKTAISQLSDTQKTEIEAEIAKQYEQKTGVARTYAQIQTAGLEDDAFDKIDFTKLEVKGQGRKSSAHRTFVDRFLTAVELDDKLGLSKSPGALLRKRK